MADLAAARPIAGTQDLPLTQRGDAPSRAARRAARLASLALALAGSASVCAQALPPGTTVQPPTREEIERGVAEGTLHRGGPVAVDTSEVERAPCPLAAPEFSNIRLKLGSVTFTGLGDLPGFDLTGTYADFVGTDQPVAVICEIRDRAATQLRAAGYLAAVQVPPQKIEGGAVRLDVMLAHLNRIQVKGDPGASEKVLLRYLGKLTQEPVFNTHRAERYLLLAKDIPGLDVRLALRPLEGSPGEVIGEVSVRRTAVYAELGAQNYGSRAVGRYSGLARVQINGLTGMGDATTASFLSTSDFDEQKVLQVGHELRIGGEGAALRGDFTYAWTNPAVTESNVDFHSRTMVAALEGSYPLIRRQANNLTASLGAQVINQDIDFGKIALNRDKLRVIYARAEASGLSPRSLTGRDGFTPFEPHWNWGLAFEVRQGLDILDATKGCLGVLAASCIGAGKTTPSHIEGTAKGFVLRASGSFDYRPVRALTLSLAPRAQYSPDALFSYEEFSGGNYTVGRGYDAGSIAGDSGFGLRSEVRVGSLLPKAAGGNAFQPYAFFDAAWVWNKDSTFDGLDPQKVFSAGAGVRASLRDTMRLDAAVAVPLHDPAGLSVKGDVRFLVNLSFQLLPWRL